ncbi:hypothetical protein B0H16DRAFT_1896824 [Mycena metata]|uniref:Uncharacterized protein n=1 Tax=Mycena metata TaxID=1033252 RepID=A0AAD7MK51_9AGAR|nr:hypothetical protein B0H16DRAFT_1896824 [Mycena metata]
MEGAGGRGLGRGVAAQERVPAPGTGSSMAGSALDESNIIIPYSPMSPTHVYVLFDPATDGLSVADSHSQPAVGRAPPTPEPSVHGRGSPSLPRRVHLVPSLSPSHPLDLDEQDVELLSAPSSSAPSERAESPFSELSRAHTHSDAHSPFVLSPELTTFSAEFRTLSSMSSPSPAHSPFVLSEELRTLSASSESGSESEFGEGAR